MTAYIQQTLWEFPGLTLETQYGKINYLAWLGLESERIGNAGGIVEIRQGKTGTAGLFHYALFVVPDPRNHQQPSRAKEQA